MMTTITGLLLNADGRPANGSACVSWVAFETHSVSIAGGQKLVEITEGEFSVTLYPNISAHPDGVYYTVRMELDTGAVYEEYWIVPDLPAATIEQVRSSFPIEPGMAVHINQLAGSGATPGMVLTWNGSYWEAAYIRADNIDPDWIRLDAGSSGTDFWIDNSPVSLGQTATIHIPSASLTARGLVTTGAQSFAGDKTFSGSIQVDGAITGPTITDLYNQIAATGAASVPVTRRVIAGTGLSGGGALSADVTLSLGAHAHSGADITSGLVAVARLGTGTPGAANYLRGDGTWAATPNTGHVIQEEGNPLTARAALNFIGDGVTATDDPANNRTNVAITGGGGGGSQTPWLTDIDANQKNLSNAARIQLTGFLIRPADAGWEWWQGQFTLGQGELQIVRRKTDGTVWYNMLTLHPGGTVGIGNQVGSAAPSNPLTVYDYVADATGADAALSNTIRRGLMVQGNFTSYDGACIQMGAGGGIGWHIKQACYNGNEGVLTFYGASAAGNNLQRVMQLHGGAGSGVTVFGNMNITGEYQISGTNIKGAMQTPWLQNIDAASRILHSVSAIAIGTATANGYLLQASAVPLGAGQGSVINVLNLATTNPNYDQLQFYIHRIGTAGGWADAAWYIRRMIDGGSVRGHLGFMYDGVQIAGAGGIALLDLNTTALTAYRRLVIAATVPGVMHYAAGGIELQSTDHPRIGFHWVGAVAAQIGIDISATVRTFNNPGGGYAPFACANITASSFNGLVMQADVSYPTANQVLRSGSNGICYFSESYFQANANITGNCNAASYNGLGFQGNGVPPNGRQIVTSSSPGYIYGYYFNMLANELGPAEVMTRLAMETNNDGFLRWGRPGNMNSYNSPAVSHVSISRYLSWGGYEPVVGFCVFDASSGYMPNHTTQAPALCSKTDPTYQWTATYPTLMAFANGATHGVRVDSARFAQLSSVNGQPLIYHNQSADFTMTGVLTHYYNGGSAGLHIVGGAGTNAGLGLLRVSTQNVNATNLICCFESQGAVRFQIASNGTIWMALGGLLKILSVDGNGFVKAT